MELNNKAETLTSGNHLFKYDLESNLRYDHFLGKNTQAGEPVFAPKNSTSNETEGYVM